jgi:hypothetical protein
VGYQEIGDLDRWLAYLTELSFLCTYSNFWSTIVVLFRPVVIVRSIELEYRRSIVIFAAADQNVSKNNHLFWVLLRSHQRISTAEDDPVIET